MNRLVYVYIINNKYAGQIWVGVTNNLPYMINQHRQNKVTGFSQKYKLQKLVYLERCSCIHRATWRRYQINSWSRKLKIRLIEQYNPEWRDQYPAMAKVEQFDV